MPFTAIWLLGSSPDLCFAYCKSWNGVAIFPWYRSGRRTCSRMIRALEPSPRSISWKGPVWYHPLKKSTPASSKKSSADTLVACLRISWAPSSLQLPRVLQLGKDWAVFVLKLSLEVMTIQISTSSGSWWMGCFSSDELGGQKSNLQRLHSTLLSASSYKWNQVALGLVCQLIAFLHSATSLGSVLGGICTKLVQWCFKTSGCSHDLTHVLL